MPCADVATVKTKPATAINLSIVFLPRCRRTKTADTKMPPCFDLRDVGLSAWSGLTQIKRDPATTGGTLR